MSVKSFTRLIGDDFCHLCLLFSLAVGQYENVVGLISGLNVRKVFVSLFFSTSTHKFEFNLNIFLFYLIEV